MQLPQPYLHMSERMIARVDQPQMWPPEGLVTDSVYGYHTIWAAEVPFIPAYTGKAESDFASESANRLTQIMERQIRFLYDLAQSQKHQTTFELRLVSWPQSGGHARVGIAFLGKTFDRDPEISRELALGLWEKFSAIFPHEAPFSYPLVPVQHFENEQSRETRSFKQWFEPLPFEQLIAPCTMVELRKYEDWPTIRDVGGALHARDYIPHPFVPALDYSAMARLFETMAHQSRVCMVTITIRPQRLTDQEITILHDMANWYQRMASGEITIDNRLLEVMRTKLKSDIADSYLRPRAELGQKVYELLRREHRSLFLTRLQVAGTPFAPDDVIEALGSEIMANAGNAYPSRWTREEPEQDALRWTRFNLQWLEFEHCGISPRVRWDRRIIRLRSLATVQEAVGAFRLPVAPGSSGIAGVEVRDEPFLLPGIPVLQEQPGVSPGTILDRGVPTGIPFILPLSTLGGVVQVYGDKSSAREQVVRQLLSELHIAGIPWRLIRKADTGGAALAQQLQARHVLVDALAGQAGDDSLHIHPFVPPPGVSLRQFTDVLLRILITVYGLEPSSSLLLRKALQETYRQAGWTEQDTGRPVTPAALAENIDAILQETNAPTNLVAQLRTHCVLPLHDLAATATGLFETLPTKIIPPAGPMIIEVGWFGSDTSITLLQDCLWAWFSLALTTTAAVSQQPRGIVGLETARSLVAGPEKDGSATSPLSSVIQLATSAHVGILLIDDRPDLIDADITSRACTTIITQTTHLPALESSGDIIGASTRQRQRISHLTNQEAVAAVRGSTTALILL